MKENFPKWEYFFDPDTGMFGFEGYLISSHAGSQHEVVLVSNENTYPNKPPQVFLKPKLGHHFYSDGSLCVIKNWRPNYSSFANTVLSVVNYLRYPENEDLW